MGGGASSSKGAQPYAVDTPVAGETSVGPADRWCPDRESNSEKAVPTALDPVQDCGTIDQSSPPRRASVSFFGQTSGSLAPQADELPSQVGEAGEHSNSPCATKVGGGHVQ